MHRRIALVTTVVLLLPGACSATVEGPASPAPAQELKGAPAMLQAQVRGAALRFVEAYRATVEGGDDLEALTASPLMQRFAHWVGVMNRAFPGEVTATSTVITVGPASPVDAAGRVLDVNLAAQIDGVAQPTGGDPLQFSIPLAGPVRLAATAPGSWRVIDFVRFGVPVSSAFVPLDLTFERRGVRIILDSFGAVPTWAFFVRIRATGGSPVTVEESDVTLIDSEGRAMAEAVEVSVPLLEVAPGPAVEGALSFERLDRFGGLSLRIDLGGDPDPAPLEIRLDPLLGELFGAGNGAG